MSKRALITAFVSLLIVGGFAAVAFASYHPLEKKPIASAPVKQRMVIEKRTVRVVKHRKPKKKVVKAAPPVSGGSGQAPVQTASAPPAYTPAAEKPAPAATHSSGNGGGGEYESDEGEDEGDEYESDEGEEEGDD